MRATFLLQAVYSIKNYWDTLTVSGPKYGYFPKPTKSYLIVKEKKLVEVQVLFANSVANITAEGKRPLGAVIGTQKDNRKQLI